MARIVSLAHSPSGGAPRALGVQQPATVRREIWRGASGREYRLRVYGLIECPPLPKGVYVLARREPDGHVTALHIGVGQNEAETVNRARVRQRGAQLGVNEVHAYFAAQSEHARALAACDLRAGQFGQLGPEWDASGVARPRKRR